MTERVPAAIKFVRLRKILFIDWSTFVSCSFLHDLCHKYDRLLLIDLYPSSPCHQGCRISLSIVDSLTKIGSRVFFYLWRLLVRPNQDGERAERLISTLFGANDGGLHRQERISASTSLRRMIRRCALATLSYDHMVPEPKFGTWILDQIPYCRSFF